MFCDCISTRRCTGSFNFQFPPHREMFCDTLRGSRRSVTFRSFSSLLIGKCFATQSRCTATPYHVTFQFPPHREMFCDFQTRTCDSCYDYIFQFPPHREMFCDRFITDEKTKPFSAMTHSIFRNLCFCTKSPKVCEIDILKDISTEIPVFAVRAPVSHWRRRRHLFFFDHSPDFRKHCSRLVLQIGRQIKHDGITLGNKIDESFGHRPLKIIFQQKRIRAELKDMIPVWSSRGPFEVHREQSFRTVYKQVQLAGKSQAGRS